MSTVVESSKEVTVENLAEAITLIKVANALGYPNVADELGYALFEVRADFHIWNTGEEHSYGVYGSVRDCYSALRLVIARIYRDITGDWSKVVWDKEGLLRGEAKRLKLEEYLAGHTDEEIVDEYFLRRKEGLRSSYSSDYTSWVWFKITRLVAAETPLRD